MGRSLIVEADGGSRGNPGVAGYGALVRDPADGRIIARRAEPLGKASNNVAEYSGLIAGLKAAVAIDAGADIDVRMDSKLVIEQMAGRWKIKHEDMRRLATQAQEIVRELRSAGGSISWNWIPREKNKDADALSNDGMDGKTVEEDLWRADAETVEQTTGSPVPQENQADARSASANGSESPRRVLLVRHGVTAFTDEGRLDGRGGPNPDLNERGRAQAERVAVGITAKVHGRPARFVASSLSRAQDTLRPAAEASGAALTVDADWDEQNFGDWDGELLRDLVQHSDFHLLRDDETFAVPGGGESHLELVERVRAALRRALDGAEPGEVVVVATHRKPIMVVLADILGLSMERAWLLAIAPGSLTGLELWSDGHGTVSFVNDTNHLRIS